MMPSHRLLAAAGVLAVLAGILVVALIRHDSADRSTPTNPVADADAPAAVQARRPPSALPTTVTPHPELGTSGVSTDDPLTTFRKQNVYPPASRPLTTKHVDLLQPNRRHETLRPTDADDGVDYLFTADRFFVLGAETITPTLAVVRDGSPVAFTVRESFVAVLDSKATADSPRYPFSVGQPFVPAKVPGLRRQTSLAMFVELSYDNGSAPTIQRARIDFEYTPESGIPARFTGAFRDAVVAGSLVVQSAIEVDRAGPYIIDCNLYDANEQPVAWTRAKVDLARGTHDVALTFFGKVLVDQRAAGAFHIGQLRGARLARGEDPDLEQMPPFSGTYTTRAYPADSFSDTEYDSEHKQRMLRMLTEQQQRGAHQGAAGSAPAGAPGDDK